MEAAGDSRLRGQLVAVWGVLCALLIARGAASLSPGMELWALGAGRFLPPAVTWATWMVAALLLVPSVSRPLAAGCGRIFPHVPASAGTTALVVAVAAAVVILPDRAWFVSDFILRLGIVHVTLPAERLFPQAPPLDLLLHVSLPRLLARWWSVDILAAERVLGVVKLLVLVGFAAAFVRLLDVPSGLRAALLAVIVTGGHLALFTGYGKATADLCVVAVAAGTYGLRLVRTGRGGVGLAIAVAAGLLLHRSGLAFLPALVVATVLGARVRSASGGARSPWSLLWLALPLSILLWWIPRLLGLVHGLDQHHLPPLQGGVAAMLATAFAPLHLLDLLNITLLLSPVALAIPLLLVLGAARAERRADLVFLSSFAGAWVVGMLFVNPFDQGAFRDWDTFAAAGVTFSLVTAWLVAAVLRRAPRHAWLAAACAVTTAVFALQELLLSHDPGAATARVEAFVVESTRSPDAHRTLALDYLGVRYGALGRKEESARAYARAAAITPSARVLYDWALAEADRGRFSESKRILARLLSAWPETPEVLYTLAAVSYLTADYAGAERAVRRSLAVAPHELQSLELLHRVETAQAAHPHASPRQLTPPERMVR